MKNNITELVFILDRSGSMAGLESDTIGGFNAMIEKQKKQDGGCYVSTVLFDDECEVLHDRVKLGDIPKMTDKDYTVRGCTALIDAIGGAIHHIGNIHKYARAEDVPEHTMFIITTDGQENASHRYTIEQVKKMIERQKEKYGWEFLFIGANIDAVETAARYGISRDRAVNYNADGEGTQILYESVAKAVCNVRASAPLGADWSEEINADYQNYTRGRTKCTTSYFFAKNLLTNFYWYAIITTRYKCTSNKTEEFMNKWSPERAEAIRQFIDEYFMENRKSPTVRDIAAGTGISKTSVQRYLTDMKEHGEIEYNGRRSIGTNLSRNMFETTPAIRYDSTVSCGLPSEPNVEEADIIPLPTALVGEGKFFILTAKGDSMTGIGVDDGDLVIVREQNTCRDGDYAVVLVNGSETLLKTITYLPSEKAYLLHAENPDYDDRIERNVQIQGVATQVIKKL